MVSEPDPVTPLVSEWTVKDCPVTAKVVAAVETVRVDVTKQPAPVQETGLVENASVAPAGRPVTERVLEGISVSDVIVTRNVALPAVP